jgi:hypothetical protein
MIRRDDEELLAHYQHAVVARRSLRGQVKAAREDGSVDYLAEAEAFFNEGQEAAYGWLLGVTPITPQRSVAAVELETIRAEYQAADAEIAADEQRFRGRVATDDNAYDVDKDSSYASGVANALSWALTRTGPYAYQARTA